MGFLSSIAAKFGKPVGIAGIVTAFAPACEMLSSQQAVYAEEIKYDRQLAEKILHQLEILDPNSEFKGRKPHYEAEYADFLIDNFALISTEGKGNAIEKSDGSLEFVDVYGGRGITSKDLCSAVTYLHNFAKAKYGHKYVNRDRYVGFGLLYLESITSEGLCKK